MRGLYAIVDVTTLRARNLGVIEFAKAVAAARPAALQLRAKDASPAEVLALLRAMGPACREASVPLFANDRVDLAILAGCDGIHVGQSDLPVRAVRELAPHLMVGVSTHDSSQVSQAIADEPDYIAFGPIFPTRSKANPDPVVGLEKLKEVVRRSPVPVVAIGGIDKERAERVGKIAPVVSMIGALVPDGLGPNDMQWVTKRARELIEALRGGSTGGVS